MDLWSLLISLLISGFCFLIYLITLKNLHQLNIQKNITPAVKEAEQLIIKNFLSLGAVPSKSKLISIVCTLANKYSIQLLSHLPIQNIIDNLIYTVMSNELLGAEQKKTVSDALLRLKTEPISSEDYIHLVLESEKKDNLQQKVLYNSIFWLLLTVSLVITGVYIAITQYNQMLGQNTVYILGMTLVASIGFGCLVGIMAITSMVRDFYFNKPTPDTKSQEALASMAKTNNNHKELNSNTTVNQQKSHPRPMLTRTFDDALPVIEEERTNKTSYSIQGVNNLSHNNSILENLQLLAEENETEVNQESTSTNSKTSTTVNQKVDPFEDF